MLGVPCSSTLANCRMCECAPLFAFRQALNLLDKRQLQQKVCTWTGTSSRRCPAENCRRLGAHRNSTLRRDFTRCRSSRCVPPPALAGVQRKRVNALENRSAGVARSSLDSSPEELYDSSSSSDVTATGFAPPWVLDILLTLAAAACRCCHASRCPLTGL